MPDLNELDLNKILIVFKEFTTIQNCNYALVFLAILHVIPIAQLVSFYIA
jgi:hypothetical protein